MTQHQFLVSEPETVSLNMYQETRATDVYFRAVKSANKVETN